MIHIEHGRPVLLISPRRYGKTSLALQAIEKTGLPFAQIDLFSAVDEYDIEHAILKGVSALISRLESIPKKALQLGRELIDGTSIKLVLTKLGIEFEAHRDREKPAYRVLDILQRLEKLAQKSNKKIVLFFDEFQCISEITPNRTMEAVLRQVAQLTKSLSFIFSGSNRHLLNELFEDRNRPFYKLCERISLDRISEKDYTKHLQKATKRRWGGKLSERELDTIYEYSERHPYYLNLLFSRVLLGDKPTALSIKSIWRQYVLEERSHVASECELLSRNQRKLLIILSRVPATKAPLGQAFLQLTNMPKASVEQSLAFLEKKDYVFKDKDSYTRVLDPLIRSVLEGA